MAVVEVVAALIWEGDRFMACQRPEHKTRALLWEFPGGKVEPGESSAQALIRECQEELGVTVEVGKLFMEVFHTYPDMTVRLRVFSCKIVQGRVRKLEHKDIRFLHPEEVEQYRFCPADKDILDKLKQVPCRKDAAK